MYLSSSRPVAGLGLIVIEDAPIVASLAASRSFPCAKSFSVFCNASLNKRVF